MPVLEAEIRPVAPTYSLPKADRSLATISQTPEVVIPPRLKTVVDPERLVATPFVISVGHFLSDNAYDLDLAILISERLNHSYSPPPSEELAWNQPYHINPEVNTLFWQQVMERHRQMVLKSGRIDETHRPLLSFGANSPDRMGASMETFVVNPDLRGQGVATSFYSNWERLLREIDYQYMTGNHYYSSYPEFFFTTLGMQRTTDIDPYITRRLGLKRDNYQSIKFLNDDFEEQVLAA